MPELLSVYQNNDAFYGAIEVIAEAMPARFEYGLERAGYECLRKVFQVRPFDQLPGLKYRYFFAHGHRDFNDPTKGLAKIRIECEHKSQTFEFPAPLSLVENLLWFKDIETLEQAAHLKKL